MADDGQLPELTDVEREVYSWQMTVAGFGEEGQRRLKAATVMVSRVGGLGGLVAYELAAAGVGRLVLAHGGTLKPSDLNRQLLMRHNALGQARVSGGIVVEGISDKQVANGSVRIRVNKTGSTPAKYWLDGQRIPAGTWFDVSRPGFHELNSVEQLPGPDLIDMLNDYFGIAVATIQCNGGNILKFMGDGILTMFDLGSIEEDAKAALDAASALRAKIGERNIERAAAGLPIADFTLALHAGEILYGNIGAENRLDFTAIGPAVNLTSRISGQHREVGQSIIVSEVVQRAAHPSPHDLVSLGRYMLRGVAEPIELYTIFEGAE